MFNKSKRVTKFNESENVSKLITMNLKDEITELVVDSTNLLNEMMIKEMNHFNTFLKNKLFYLIVIFLIVKEKAFE